MVYQNTKLDSFFIVTINNLHKQDIINFIIQGTIIIVIIIVAFIINFKINSNYSFIIVIIKAIKAFIIKHHSLVNINFIQAIRFADNQILHFISISLTTLIIIFVKSYYHNHHLQFIHLFLKIIKTTINFIKIKVIEIIIVRIKVIKIINFMQIVITNYFNLHFFD